MSAFRSRAAVVIAVDDTDIPGQGGTGNVARRIAERLSTTYPVWGVTRHQFAVLPEIPYTARNSGNVVHLLAGPETLEPLADEVVGWVRALHIEGSEPGICVARVEALLDQPLGCEAQRRFVHRSEAWAAAAAAGVILRHAIEADDGIVGAFAGACLAAQGDDGRFVQVGRMRALAGDVQVADVLAAGGDEVRSVEGAPVTQGLVRAEKVRPALREGRCVVYCRWADGVWLPVHGAPGDKEREEEDRLHAR
jgi:hypothetical protein